jgi:hypothetical protein
MRSDPTHITVVGSKRDAAARALYASALAAVDGYRRIEWWDRSEGKLPNADVAYPKLPRASAFICTDKICSAPIYKADEIAPTVARLGKRDGPT